MALAITAFAYCSADAQICKTPVRHKTVARVAPRQKTTTSITQCRLVPYQVCTITPDRQHVSCYKTTDLDNLTPLNMETTFYGPTGDIPGQAEPQNVKTVVIPGASRGDYCKRDVDGKATVCRYTGPRLYRDDNGYYNYR